MNTVIKRFQHLSYQHSVTVFNAIKHFLTVQTHSDTQIKLRVQKRKCVRIHWKTSYHLKCNRLKFLNFTDNVILHARASLPVVVRGRYRRTLKCVIVLLVV